jgi:hypothetical protein
MALLLDSLYLQYIRIKYKRVYINKFFNSRFLSTNLDDRSIIFWLKINVFRMCKNLLLLLSLQVL